MRCPPACAGEHLKCILVYSSSSKTPNTSLNTDRRHPNCILCHSDPDGIKGNDPRTHASGFLNDSNGDWHTDGASVCYDCHSNTNTAGIGFCGYCHGAK